MSAEKSTGQGKLEKLRNTAIATVSVMGMAATLFAGQYLARQTGETPPSNDKVVVDTVAAGKAGFVDSVTDRVAARVVEPAAAQLIEFVQGRAQ